MKKVMIFQKILHCRKSHEKAEYINIKIPPGIFKQGKLYQINFYEIDTSEGS